MGHVTLPGFGMPGKVKVLIVVFTTNDPELAGPGSVHTPLYGVHD